MRRADGDASASLADRTIRDFGDQWSHHGEDDGYYASLELLQDVFGPLLALDELRGLRTADVGSGTGRIARMLLEAGAEHVIAVEPSSAVHALRSNLGDAGDRVEVIHGTGEALPPGLDLDFVISYGVIQFIPQPDATLRAAFEALRPGGRLVIWVYGKEGVGSYLALLQALRGFTTRLPHFALSGLCSLLNAMLGVYIPLCRVLPLPLRDYALHTLARLSREHRKLVIYDQLNPSYVKYYTREEVLDLIRRAGFANPRIHHRRGYSWTVLAERPADAAKPGRGPAGGRPS